MAIKEKRHNEARRLTASLLNALAIGGVATAVFTPFGMSGHSPTVEIATRITYLLLAIYLHLCGHAAVHRIEEEKS
jgi:hypothetical protein